MRATSKLKSSAHPSLNLTHPTPDCFTWNTILKSHSANPPDPLPPLLIYRRLRLHHVHPDPYTFPFLLQSFKSPSHLRTGRQIHTHVLLYALIGDPFARNSLINMYSDCGSLDDARRLFEEVRNPDLPTWNSMIHCNLNFGFLENARQLFDVMPERNVLTWSCMIDGYVKCGSYKGALGLFRKMQKLVGIRPNEFTMSSVLVACAKLGALEHGKWAHAYIDKCGMRINVILGTSLIEMYAKCGSIEQARMVFDQLGSDRDVMTWSAMITGLAIHGHGNESLALFEKMLECKVRPNGITFLGVLCACVHGALVDKGAEYFNMMQTKFGIAPTMKHYGCIVDLYSRAGLIDKAWHVVNSMPMIPDVVVWGALLSGSTFHGQIEMCKIALKQLMQLEPMNSGAHVILSNLCMKIGRWEDARQIRKLMGEKGLTKTPGCSLVEVGDTIHEFFAGDESHPEMKDIYQMLEEIMTRLKAAGYVAKTKEVLFDLDEEGKEQALSVHSEKLAVAFSLIKSKPGTTIRVIKNIRICTDCHEAMKLIAQIYCREIVVRDCRRFHHFQYGLCSCNDFW